MKSFAKTLLIASLGAAAAMAQAADGFAQDAIKTAAPDAPPALETLSYKDINANIQNAENNAENNGGALYDPVVINPEISDQTTKKAEAARSVLEQTHESPIPAPQNPPSVRQGLPGEEALDEQVEQIAELNQIKPGEPLTLRRALLIADEKNIDLAAARVKIQTANAQLKQAWALLLPSISASVSYAHVYNNSTASSMASAMQSAVSPAYQSLGALSQGLGSAAQSLSAIDPNLGAQLRQLATAVGSPLADVSEDSSASSKTIDSVSLGITVGLSIINVAGWFKLRAADEAVDITELGVEDGRQQILAGVVQAYLAALLCGEVVKVQRVQLKSALDQLSLAQGKYDRGADVRLSVIQAQFGVEKQRQALIDAIWSYETARDALANLLSFDGLPVPQPTHIKSADLTDDAALEDEAVENNRTLKINRMTQRINELSLNAAIADFVPTLSGAFQYNYNLKPASGVDGSSWTLALTASIPLFDYSKFGALDEKKAAILETRLSMESTIASTKTAVRKAKREYYSSVFNVDNAKRQVELAREALQLTEASYKNGASTFIDVSDARNNVASASISYITAAIQAELSMISLITTLGRDIMEVVY